jgi:hypothetical protein
MLACMPRKPKPPHDDPEQSKRFIDMAREIGADANKEEFDRALKRLGRRKPAREAGDNTAGNAGHQDSSKSSS